jgi:hypothetical protein
MQKLKARPDLIGADRGRQQGMASQRIKDRSDPQRPAATAAALPSGRKQSSE